MSDGERSRFIFEEVIDEDLASQYPFLILSMNISPETFILKIDVTSMKTIIEKNKVKVEEEDRTFEFIGDYVSGDYVNIGVKYLNYPTVEDFVKEIEMMNSK